MVLSMVEGRCVCVVMVAVKEEKVGFLLMGVELLMRPAVVARSLLGARCRIQTDGIQCYPCDRSVGTSFGVLLPAVV